MSSQMRTKIKANIPNVTRVCSHLKWMKTMEKSELLLFSRPMFDASASDVWSPSLESSYCAINSLRWNDFPFHHIIFSVRSYFGFLFQSTKEISMLRSTSAQMKNRKKILSTKFLFCFVNETFLYLDTRLTNWALDFSLSIHLARSATACACVCVCRCERCPRECVQMEFTFVISMRLSVRAQTVVSVWPLCFFFLRSSTNVWRRGEKQNKGFFAVRSDYCPGIFCARCKLEFERFARFARLAHTLAVTRTKKKYRRLPEKRSLPFRNRMICFCFTVHSFVSSQMTTHNVLTYVLLCACARAPVCDDKMRSK